MHDNFGIINIVDLDVDRIEFYDTKITKFAIFQQQNVLRQIFPSAADHLIVVDFDQLDGNPW